MDVRPAPRAATSPGRGVWPGLFRAKSVLVTGFCLTALAALCPVWADNAVITGIRLVQTGLVIQGNTMLPQPKLQSWPSESGGRKTEIVVLDFPQVAPGALQPAISDILSAHPEIKRLVVTKLASDSTRLLLETERKNTGSPLKPTLKTQESQWILNLGSGVFKAIPPAKPAVQTMQAARIQPAPVKPPVQEEVVHVQAVRTDDVAVKQPATGKKLAQAKPVPKTVAARPTHQTEFERLQKQVRELQEKLDLANTHLQASVQDNLKLQQELQALKQQQKDAEKTSRDNNPSSPAVAASPELSEARREIMKMATEMQKLFEERSALENENAQLKQKLSQQESKMEGLEAKASMNEEFIRMYDPLMQGQGRVENMQKALLQLAKRLKDTESALDKQTAKTQELAAELAQVKNDPAILKDPNLVFKPDTDTRKDKKSEQAPEKIPGPIIYKKPDVLTETVNGSIEPISLQESIPRNQDYSAIMQPVQDYLARKKYGKAENVLMDLLQADPTYSPAYRELTKLYMLENKYIQAQAALETYKRLNPSDAEAALLQQQIQSKLTKEKR